MEWPCVNPADAAIPRVRGTLVVAPTSARCGLGARLAIVRDVASMFGSIDSLAGAMTYHRARQSVLAGNISNLETPGYRPADLQRVVSPAASLIRTDPAHFDVNGGTGAGEFQLVFDDGGKLSGPDGNAVTLDREMAKMSANGVRYNTSTELVNRRLALLRYAAGDGVG